MNLRLFSIVWPRLAMVMAGVVTGALIILGVRFALYQPPNEVHYHANFAVYINGQREEFKSPSYYEEVAAACTSQQVMTPHERAHMHDNVNDVVHVEDDTVTWGQFFQNLGWVVDPEVIRTPDATLTTGNETKVTFILNGEEMPNIVNRVIEDKDRLLVDYGHTSATTLKQEYGTVATTAHHYDVTPDPESCSGHKAVTVQDRLMHLF